MFFLPSIPSLLARFLFLSADGFEDVQKSVLLILPDRVKSHLEEKNFIFSVLGFDFCSESKRNEREFSVLCGV